MLEWVFNKQYQVMLMEFISKEHVNMVDYKYHKISSIDAKNTLDKIQNSYAYQNPSEKNRFNKW